MALLTFLIHVSSARAIPYTRRLLGNLAEKLTPLFFFSFFFLSFARGASFILFISRSDRSAAFT